MHLLHLIQKIANGQSVLRVYMNDALRSIAITGEILDVGGGRNPDYFSYLMHEGTTNVTTIDGKLQPIDFEKDDLPRPNASCDTVLLFNVLEHIFNHAFLVGEVFRVLKKRGRLVGFVPFFIRYHPDPRDYFRYTNEALETIFKSQGFSRITVMPVGRGPHSIHCNNLVQGMPRFLRPFWFLWCYILDGIYLHFRPDAALRFPLGYIFICEK